MTALALVLHLTLAAPGLPSPGLVPQLDPGPFQARELVAASAGVFLGDAAVLGGAYAALMGFTNGTFSPSASNFRTFAYALGVSALLVPPLTAALLARVARSGDGSGATWKAILLATAGQSLALAVGYLAAPRFWVVIPVQLVALAAGASFGLHWGPRPRLSPAASPDARREPADPAGPPPPSQARAPAICADPALATG